MEKFKTIIGSLVAGILVASVFWVIYFNKESELIETSDIQSFEKLSGLEFTDAERDSILVTVPVLVTTTFLIALLQNSVTHVSTLVSAMKLQRL